MDRVTPKYFKIFLIKVITHYHQSLVSIILNWLQKLCFSILFWVKSSYKLLHFDHHHNNFSIILKKTYVVVQDDKNNSLEHAWSCHTCAPSRFERVKHTTWEENSHLTPMTQHLSGTGFTHTHTQKAEILFFKLLFLCDSTLALEELFYFSINKKLISYEYEVTV